MDALHLVPDACFGTLRGRTAHLLSVSIQARCSFLHKSLFSSAFLIFEMLLAPCRYGRALTAACSSATCKARAYSITIEDDLG